MALIKTNATASMSGHLNPFTIEMLVPLASGDGTSDVLEIGRYNDMSILIPSNDYPSTTGFINFEGCDTPDGTFLPLRCGSSSALSTTPQLKLNVQATTAPALFLLSGDDFGQEGAIDAISFRGFTVPYVRFVIEGASAILTATPLVVTLKMY